MNIAIFADIHGRILLCFKLCERWQRETGEQLDLVLQAGDLGVFPDVSRLDKATIRHTQDDPSELGFTHDFAEHKSDVAEELAKTAFPLIFVRGNHEDQEWLDALEQKSDAPIFAIDPYERIFCLKTGVPYTFNRGGEAITIVGIGRVAAPRGEQKPDKPKYIQPHELERLYSLGKVDFDILLTHDSAIDSVTKGFGMEEIRLVLDAYEPVYHFHGHTEEPLTRREDRNGTTVVYKMADLHWDKTSRGKPLEPGAMGILRWKDRSSYTFEVVNQPWLKEYTASTWRYIP
ncbi:MAG: metallophosphoesterase [Chloroflexota bacterium]